MNDLNNADWLAIGFKFGIGFFLASTIFGVVGGLIGYGIVTHQVRVALDGLPQQATFQPPPVGPAMQQLQDTAQQAVRNLAPPAQAQSRPALPATTIAPSENKRCIEEAHGVFDERYQRCIQGR